MITQRELERIEGEEWLRKKELDAFIKDEELYRKMSNDVEYLKKIGVYDTSETTITGES